MGNNPMNVPYIVGMHPNSPQNPHSAMASGGDNINAIRTQPKVEAHVLYGAMVGGPLQYDRFWDWRDDWVQTEVALDYNSVIPGLAAMQVSRPRSARAKLNDAAHERDLGPVLRQTASRGILDPLRSTMR